MTPEQRKRAGLAVGTRIIELGMTGNTVARDTGLNVQTVRALVRGQRWPREKTRELIAKALDWPPDEIERRATDTSADFKGVDSGRLLEELCERFRSGQL